MRTAIRQFGTAMLGSILVILAASPTATAPARGDDKEKPRPKTSSPDLALVPADSLIFVSLDIGRYWNGPEAATLKEISRTHPIVVTWWNESIEKALGLGVDRIERLVVVMPNPSSWVVILSAPKPFDRAKVLEALVPEATEKKAGGKSYFASEKSKHAVLLVDPRTYVSGSADGVKSFLEQPAPADGAGALGAALEAAEKKPLLVAGINSLMLRGLAKELGPRGEYLPLVQAKSWQVTVEAVKDNLQVRLRADFPAAEAAEKAVAPLEKFIGTVDEYLANSESTMPEFVQREQKQYPKVKELQPRMMAMLSATRTGLKGAAVQQKGTAVEATVLVKTDEPATTFLLLLSMMPRAAK